MQHLGWERPLAKADRKSETLTFQQVETLQSARRHAKMVSLPLNYFVTIRLEKCVGLTGAEGAAQARLAPILERARHWLVRRGETMTHVWVAEKGDFRDGLHVHLHIHIPGKPRQLRHDFVQMMGEWTGVPLDPINRRNKHVIGQAEVEWPGESTAWEIVRIYGDEDHLEDYCLKALRKRYSSRIVGKRCGTSNNLGPASRASMGRST
jgi:hypothetical protein